MKTTEFLSRIRQNPHNVALLERLAHTGLPDVWLVSGCLFQTVWNTLTDRPPAYGIRDYDVFYFDDRDLGWEAEDKTIKKAAYALRDLHLPVEIRNQARVHLWYSEKFGKSYPPLTSGRHGIDRFLATACMVGLQPRTNGDLELYAPKGLGDLANLIVRPNTTDNFKEANYQAKTERWKRDWPELTVLPPP